MLTPEDLKAIRERAEKATLGPWHWKACGNQEYYGIHAEHCDVVSALGQSSDCFWIPKDEDAAFIVAARTDIPKLLDHIEVLERAVEILLVQLEAVYEMPVLRKSIYSIAEKELEAQK